MSPVRLEVPDIEMGGARVSLGSRESFTPMHHPFFSEAGCCLSAVMLVPEVDSGQNWAHPGPHRGNS